VRAKVVFWIQGLFNLCGVMCTIAGYLPTVLFEFFEEAFVLGGREQGA
jgi:hypothetical protein